jgi:IS1 family transposase
MNRLPIEKRAQILALLCEGSSMRAVSRLVDCSINTVTRELLLAGQACADFHDRMVLNVKARRVQCDEIWSFVYAKQKNVPQAKRGEAGDVWTWTALDADSKLIISYLIGGRGSDYAMVLMDDLRSRLANRVQLTTDGHAAYLEAVEGAFGGDVDYAMLVKLYGETPDAEKRYSPAACIGARKTKIEGDPDPAHISTSYTERANLTMRMHMRRFTRLTNGFSKKIANHAHMVALYTVWYNWIRLHKSLRTTPAMAAGLTDKLMTLEDVVRLIDELEAQQKAA